MSIAWSKSGGNSRPAGHPRQGILGGYPARGRRCRTGFRARPRGSRFFGHFHGRLDLASCSSGPFSASSISNLKSQISNPSGGSSATVSSAPAVTCRTTGSRQSSRPAPALHEPSPRAGCTIRAWICSAAGVPAGQCRTRAKSTMMRNVNRNAQSHADVVSPLGIGQPLFPARRHANAAAQETPPPGRADLQGIEFDRRFRRLFRRRREAVGQRVVMRRIVRLRAVRFGRRDDRGRRQFPHAIRFGDHRRRFRPQRFGSRFRHLRFCRRWFQSLGDRDLPFRRLLSRRPSRIGPFWRRLGHSGQLRFRRKRRKIMSLGCF